MALPWSSWLDVPQLYVALALLFLIVLFLFGAAVALRPGNADAASAAQHPR